MVGESADAAGEAKAGNTGEVRPQSVRLHFLRGGSVFVPSQAPRSHTPAAVLNAASVSSTHQAGRMVRFKGATPHIWTCHYIEQELKMPTAHSAVLQVPVLGGTVWESGRWSHAEADDGTLPA